MLNLSEVVGNVLVQDDLSNGPERELCVWPDLGQVEDVVAELLSLLGSHGLLRSDIMLLGFRMYQCSNETYHKDVPCGELAALDLREELLSGVVGVGSAQLHGSVVVESLGTTLPLEVDLNVLEVTLSVDELECVSRVAVHVVAVRSSTVREEDHDLVDGLGVLGEVILQQTYQHIMTS